MARPSHAWARTVMPSWSCSWLKQGGYNEVSAMLRPQRECTRVSCAERRDWHIWTLPFWAIAGWGATTFAMRQDENVVSRAAVKLLVKAAGPGPPA
mmetsp:Transcript_36361/g.60253  ORF Transcript_36361/g.60253 Transcript_36361/m.60253 type:complete len:96 (-) Transcript_36361:152-439(-)